jgi:type II secretory pathway pseudopilin PulG
MNFSAMKNPSTLERQRGISLIEAIISVGLMAVAITLVIQYQSDESNVDTGRKEAQALQSFQALAAQYFINHRGEIEAAIEASDSSDPLVQKHCVGFIKNIGDELNLTPSDPADRNGSVLWSGTKKTCALDLTLLQHRGVSPVFNVSHNHALGSATTFRHVAVFRREAGSVPDSLSPDTHMLVLAVAEGTGGTSTRLGSGELKNLQGQSRVLGESGGVVPIGHYGNCSADNSKVEVCGQGWRFDLSEWVDDIGSTQAMLP